MIIFKTHHKLLFVKVYQYIIPIGNLSKAKMTYVVHNTFFETFFELLTVIEILLFA